MRVPMGMKAADTRKILAILRSVTADSFDRVAVQLKDGDAAEFGAAWTKLSRDARELFVGELMKAYALVIAGSVITKAGVKFAGDHQKQLRKLILFIADVLQPDAKTKKKLKKKAKKLKKKAKKAVATS